MRREPGETFVSINNKPVDTLGVDDNSYKEFREALERGKEGYRESYVDAGKMIRSNEVLRRSVTRKELIELSDRLLSIIEENKGGLEIN